MLSSRRLLVVQSNILPHIHIFPSTRRTLVRAKCCPSIPPHFGHICSLEQACLNRTYFPCMCLCICVTLNTQSPCIPRLLFHATNNFSWSIWIDKQTFHFAKAFITPNVRQSLGVFLCFIFILSSTANHVHVLISFAYNRACFTTYVIPNKFVNIFEYIWRQRDLKTKSYHAWTPNNENRAHRNTPHKGKLYFNIL